LLEEVRLVGVLGSGWSPNPEQNQRPNAIHDPLVLASGMPGALAHTIPNLPPVLTCA
jgi:hypothetical protein